MERASVYTDMVVNVNNFKPEKVKKNNKNILFP